MVETIPLMKEGPIAVQAAKHSRPWVGFVPLLVLPVATFGLRNALVPWTFMWLLAFSIFAGCKWQTWWDAREIHGANVLRSLGYLLLWPGMDARAFFSLENAKIHLQASLWIKASFKVIAGLVLIAIAMRLVYPKYPLGAGWTGMLGIVLFLHFGTFELISLAWRYAGVRAEPIMCRPFRSESLAELWGKRWNLGFRTLSHALVFRPLQKRFGATAGISATFLASGLIHDLVISVPAAGGYGLPTAYFLLQGCGVLVERSDSGQRLGMGRGASGRVWTALIALGPLCLLFHPWFVRRVILPFLAALLG